MAIDVLIAVWCVRIVGALAFVLFCVAGAWKVCERILEWFGLYAAFRHWWIAYVLWKVGRETRGKPQPHRCWCGHQHAMVEPPQPAPTPPPKENR